MESETKISKLINKYNEMSAPIKASFWFTICSILQKGITLLTTPIFTRILTTEQYGVYSIYQSWYSIISIFATLNLSAGVLFNGLTKYSEDRLRIISSFQGLSTTVTFILFIIYLCGMNFFNNIFDLSSLLMIMMFMELAFVPAYAFWAVKERYDYKYRKLIIITLLVTLGSQVIGMIAIMLTTTYKAEARIISYVVIQIIQGIIFYVINIMRGKKFFVKEYWIYALKFNLPLIPHYLSMTILNQADRIMISKYIGMGAAAIYAIAYQISMMMTIITTAVNNSFVPYTYKNMKQNRYEAIGKNSNVLLVVIGTLCIVAMSFSPEVIKVFASKEYYDAIWIVPPVAASVYFIFLYSLFANIEFYFEKTKYVMVASIGGAAINIILNFIFIKKFGYLAAGYTTLVCYILFSFAHFYYYKKILKQMKINNVYNIKIIVLISIVVILFMVVMPLLYVRVILRYIFILMILLVVILNKDKVIDIFKTLKK